MSIFRRPSTDDLNYGLWESKRGMLVVGLIVTVVLIVLTLMAFNGQSFDLPPIPGLTR